MDYEPNFDRNQRRSAERRRTQMRRRRMMTRYVTLIVVSLTALLVTGVLIWRAIKKPETPQLSQPTTTQSAPTTQAPSTTQSVPTEPSKPIRPTDEITLVFGGDLVANDLVVSAGDQQGRYDFTSVFRDVLPALAMGDATFLNFEGNTYGSTYGTATSAAPVELLQAVANAGVDFIQMANSCTITKTNGLLSLEKTLQDIEKAGMIPVGAYSDQQKAQQEQGFTLCQIGELRVAVVGYTKGFDGVSLPQNSQWCVNLLYTDYSTTYQKVAEDAIKTTLQQIQAQKPDLVVAMLHWGSLHKDIISGSQEKIEKLLLENGVDAIIGTHSHLVQQVKFDEEVGTVVAYSLGDFFGGGEKNGSHYSILLQLKVTRDNYTGETAITGCDYVPIYTLSPERDGEPMQVVRIETAIEQYENSHIHRVNATAYENMKAALKQILRRVGF